MNQAQTIPETFLGVGYTRDRAGLPLEAVRVPVSRPAAEQVLIRMTASSLNPVEYKLADLNFLGRTPPVALGLDLAGVVVAVGDGDGGWVATGETGGDGGYALAHQFLTVAKPPSVSFRDAAALPMAFLSAFAGLYPVVRAGDTVYIPGGGGGVGHQQRQHAAINRIGPAVRSPPRFRLQARRHRRRDREADGWPGRRPRLRRHLQRAWLRRERQDRPAGRQLDRARCRPRQDDALGRNAQPGG